MKPCSGGRGNSGLTATPATPTANMMEVAAMRRVTDVLPRYLQLV